MRVRFTTPARNYLDRIRLFIAKRNPEAARRVVWAIHSAARQLADFPLMAPEVDMPAVRAKLAISYPFLLFNTIRNDEVQILRVRHAAQQPPSAADL